MGRNVMLGQFVEKGLKVIKSMQLYVYFVDILKELQIDGL